MMGHGQKNANRAAGIQDNRTKIQGVIDDAEQGFKDAAKLSRAIAARVDALNEFEAEAKLVMVSLGVRLTNLERPLWRRVTDWLARGWRFVVTKKVGDVDGVTVEEVEEPEEGVVVIDSLPRDDAPTEEQHDDETPVDEAPVVEVQNDEAAGPES